MDARNLVDLSIHLADFQICMGDCMGHTISHIDLREGPCSQGASWGVCGSGVPPYDFLNVYGIFNIMLGALPPQPSSSP
jgi:hypothetical protein